MKRDCVWGEGRWGERDVGGMCLETCVCLYVRCPLSPDILITSGLISDGPTSCQAPDKIINIRLRVCPLAWWSCVSVHASMPICMVCVSVSASVCLQVISTETQRPNLLQSIPSMFKGESISLSVCLRLLLQTRSWPQPLQLRSERDMWRSWDGWQNKKLVECLVWKMKNTVPQILHCSTLWEEEQTKTLTADADGKTKGDLI